MGEVVAWGQLRSGGQQGSAIADELIKFGSHDDWTHKLADFARDYSHKTERDFDEFAQAFDQNKLCLGV